EPQPEHGQGPDDVEQGYGTDRLGRKRVPATAELAFQRWLDPGELVNGIEHRVRGRGAADGPLPAEIVPNFAVTLLGLLEQSGRSGGNVVDCYVRHGAPQLGEGL